MLLIASLPVQVDVEVSAQTMQTPPSAIQIPGAIFGEQLNDDDVKTPPVGYKPL